MVGKVLSAVLTVVVPWLLLLHGQHKCLARSSSRSSSELLITFPCHGMTWSHIDTAALHNSSLVHVHRCNRDSGRPNYVDVTTWRLTRRW